MFVVDTHSEQTDVGVKPVEVRDAAPTPSPVSAKLRSRLKLMSIRSIENILTNDSTKESWRTKETCLHLKTLGEDRRSDALVTFYSSKANVSWYSLSSNT